jgi:hypothetical protein
MANGQHPLSVRVYVSAQGTHEFKQTTAPSINLKAAGKHTHNRFQNRSLCAEIRSRDLLNTGSCKLLIGKDAEESSRDLLRNNILEIS